MLAAFFVDSSPSGALDRHRVTGFQPQKLGLYRLVEGDVLPWLETRKKELANRPLIREQAFGDALDADKLNPHRAGA